MENQRETDRIFFQNSDIQRPAIKEVVSMAAQGWDELSLHALAKARNYVMPHPIALERIATDVDTLLPYAEVMIAKISTIACGKVAVFAGRDGEMLADLFVLRNPDHPSALLPASVDLWKSESMQNPKLARPFLDAHQLDVRTVEKHGAMLFDTGFEGSIGNYAWNTLAKVHPRRGKNAERNVQFYKKRLPLQLVAANKDSKWATTLLDFGPTGKIAQAPGAKEDLAHSAEVEWLKERFPFSHTGISRDERNRGWINMAIAVALQLLPRYHSSFEKLAIVKGEVIAVPQGASIAEESGSPSQPAEENESDQHYTPDMILDNNTSLVNPVAAACVQLRIARHVIGKRSIDPKAFLSF